EGLAEDGFPVTAACWLKEADGGQWFLYIASPKVDPEGNKPAYREFRATYIRLKPMWIRPFEVKLIPPDDPVAQEVEGIHRRYPGPMDTWVGGGQFGGVPVEQAFVYGIRAAARGTHG